VLLAAGAVGGLAALLLVVLAPWKRESPLATERALAAIGERPVIHVVNEEMRPEATTIDLTSGATTAQFVRWELWYDGARGLLRMRLTRGGHFVSELLQTPRGSFSARGFDRFAPTGARFDPVLAGFATRYRDALQRGQAKVVGEEEIDGRKAIVIRIRVRAGKYEDVAVDANSYRPLRWVRYITNAGKSAWLWRFITIETLARNKDQFVRPQRSTMPSQQNINNGRTLSPRQAATALKQRAYWPGATVSRVPLTKIALVRLTTRWSDGRQTKTHALEVQYGRGRGRRPRPSAPWLFISEATSRKGSFLYSSFDQPPLRRGKLRLIGSGGRGSGMWIGLMRKEGIYIVLQSPERSLILEAAHAMTPLP
jgi:hypothetical protein